jgi:hypothetical protein
VAAEAEGVACEPSRCTVRRYAWRPTLRWRALLPPSNGSTAVMSARKNPRLTKLAITRKRNAAKRLAARAKRRSDIIAAGGPRAARVGDAAAGDTLDRAGYLRSCQERPQILGRRRQDRAGSGAAGHGRAIGNPGRQAKLNTGPDHEPVEAARHRRRAACLATAFKSQIPRRDCESRH